jgi:peptide chain release factor 3
LARDSQGCLSFLTTSEFQLNYCINAWPEVAFYKTRDIN